MHVRPQSHCRCNEQCRNFDQTIRRPQLLLGSRIDMRYHLHGGLGSPVLVGLMELRERAARLLRSKLNPYR
jgi:hypothetical protein